MAQVVLKRALQDVMGQLPAVEVAIALPAIKASLSDYEYQLITSVAGANLGEVTLFRDLLHFAPWGCMSVHIIHVLNSVHRCHCESLDFLPGSLQHFDTFPVVSSVLVLLPAHVICINRQSSLVLYIPGDPAIESKIKRRRQDGCRGSAAGAAPVRGGPVDAVPPRPQRCT